MNDPTIADAGRASEIARIAKAHAGRVGALLPILHEVQAAFGFIPPDSIPAIAEALNLSRAEVHGVVSFYHDFKSEAPDRPAIRLCRAEACQARGAEALAAHAVADARISVEDVYCLGLCASGPAAIIGGRVVARLDRPRLERLIGEIVP